MNKTLFVTVGVPGSGKTNWARQEKQSREKGTCKIVCRDVIRAKKSGFSINPAIIGITNHIVDVACTGKIIKYLTVSTVHTVIYDGCNVDLVPLKNTLDAVRTAAKALGVDLRILPIILPSPAWNIKGLPEIVWAKKNQQHDENIKEISALFTSQ